MPKKNNRQGRIDEEFRKELSQIISYDLKEPSVTGMISVTRVKVTPDLKYAKVSVSILNSKNVKETLAGLKKSSGYLRSELAKRINLRNNQKELSSNELSFFECYLLIKVPDLMCFKIP